MVFAEEIRHTILKLAEQAGPEQSFTSSDIARMMDKENWQELIEQVRFVASIMVKEGKIDSIRDTSTQSIRFRKVTDSISR